MFVVVNKTFNITLGLWSLTPHKHEDQYKPTVNDPYLLYFHDFTGDRRTYTDVYNELLKNFHVIVFDYRNLVNDSVQLYKWLKQNTNSSIYVWGNQLGAAVAAHTVVKLQKEQIEPVGLILENPYLSIGHYLEQNWFIANVVSYTFWYKQTITNPLHEKDLSFSIIHNILSINSPIMFVLYGNHRNPFDAYDVKNESMSWVMKSMFEYRLMYLITLTTREKMWVHSQQRSAILLEDVPNSYYVVKRLLAVPTINKLKRRLKKAQLITNETIQEQPRKLVGEDKTNTQFFYGVDESGNSLYLKLILKKHRQAEVILVLNVNGKNYTFPNEEKTLMCNVGGQTWHAGGLTLKFIEPLRRVRITFKGLLRPGSGNTVHVEFSFLWTSASKAFYYPQDVPTAVLSDALAKERWRNGEWIKMLGDEKGYEQYGVLRGSVTHGFSKVELYLRGFRKRYWGRAEHLTQHRDFSLFVIGEDGLALNIGVKSYCNGCDDANLNGLSLIRNFAAKKSYKCIVSQLIKNAVVTKGNGWALNIVPCKFIINAQQGEGFVSFWQLSHNTIKPYLRPKPFVTSLSDQMVQDASLAGEKAKYLALALLIKPRNFAVPEGFVVLANAFEAHVDKNLILKKTIDGKIDKSKELFASLLLTELVRESIGQAVIDEIDRISNGNKYTWTVRSSGMVNKTSGFDECGNTAVIVQKTVPEEISGVLHSHDPFQIAIKPKRHLRVADGVEPQLCLSNDQISTLKNAAVTLEKELGFFCKIRWCFSDNILHVLQVEPRLDICNWTDDELLHEFDSPVMAKNVVRTTASIQEIVPGALTPLTASIVKDFMNNYLYQPFGAKLVSLHKQHLMLNVSNYVLHNVSKINLAYDVFKNVYKLEKYVEECRNVISKKPDKMTSSALDIIKNIESKLMDLNKIGEYHVRVTRHNIAQMLLLTKLLLPFSSNFKLFHELKQAADGICQLNLEEEFCKISPSCGYDWLEVNCPDVYQFIKTFLKKYGQRGVRELFFRKLLNYLSKACRRSLLHRQELEQYVLDILDLIRAMVQDLSIKMTDERLLSDAKLVYYLSLYELKNLVLYPSWDKIRLPTFVPNYANPISTKIKGTFLGDAGDVMGRACVVSAVIELQHLRPGDVLITKSVSDKWEPYFSKISGLVTETSGIFSSGANTAKEHGLPCLVDAQNASLVFKTGDNVLISQKNSTIELLP
ncbi:hypothetical protein RN001_011346 [Aquatica leii]|uniref:PEP-utilising enzyme mobile domain-containing protein n=1 Tax=Aquatica leii TaxID=1421715 RepID=A0AAN7Q404_9COLE|nr:hypothetical protein RN001_011346 [Aquatica leii]